MAFHFKNTNKGIILNEEVEEDYRNHNFCRFCDKNIESDKCTNHCHSTGNYRGPAHQNCNTNVTQKQRTFIPFVFHIFSNYDCHSFFEKLAE